MKKKILVTGAHRSGSTWTGKIIAESNQVNYVHEPFNVGKLKYNPPLKYWFEYVGPETEAKRQQEIKKYITSFYSVSPKYLIQNLKKVHTARELYHFLLDTKKKTTRRPIVKDPIALMAAEWFYHELEFDVIVLIRHPAAFVASLKVKDWQFDFNQFLEQKFLMDNYLKDFEEEIIALSNTKKDIIDQGILLWNTLHATIHQYREKYSDQWYFIKHEDLSLDPISEFEKIFNFLQLNFSEKVKSKIIDSTTSTVSDAHIRDSKQNIKTWKDRLTEEEISRIKEGTKKVWKHFYTGKDWI